MLLEAIHGEEEHGLPTTLHLGARLATHGADPARGNTGDIQTSTLCLGRILTPVLGPFWAAKTGKGPEHPVRLLARAKSRKEAEGYVAQVPFTGKLYRSHTSSWLEVIWR